MTTEILTVKLKTIDNEELDRLYAEFMEFLRAYTIVFLAFRQEDTKIRYWKDENDEPITVGLDQWKQILRYHEHIPADDEMKQYRKLFDYFMGEDIDDAKQNKSTHWCNPLYSPYAKPGRKTHKGNEVQPHKRLMRQMEKKTLLPISHIRDIGLNKETPKAACHSACELVRSWVKNNERTKQNYNKQKSKVASTQCDTTMLDKLTHETGLYVNEKLLEKIKKYKFDVRYAKQEMELAQKLCPDIEYWQKAVALRVEENRLNNLSPESVFSMPHITKHVKSMEFGSNYISFGITPYSVKNGTAFIIKIDDNPVYCLATKQIVNCSIEKNKENENFSVQYLTGNKKKDRLKAELKSIRIQKIKSNDKIYNLLTNGDLSSKDVAAKLKISRKEADAHLRNLVKQKMAKEIKNHFRAIGQYEIQLPLNVELSDVATEAKTYYLSEPTKSLRENPKFKPSNKIIVAACDINHNPLANFVFHTIDANGNIVNQQKLTAGKIESRNLCDQFDNTRIKINHVRKLIQFNKSIKSSNKLHERAVKSFNESLGYLGLGNVDDYHENIDDHVRNLVGEIKNKMKDLAKLKAGDKSCKFNNAATTDQFKWLILYRDYVRMLKSKTYENKEPLKPGEKRPPQDFSRKTKYLSNLKNDFLKKWSFLIVNTAMQQHAKILIHEDIDPERSKSKYSRRNNDLWDIFSPRRLLDWLEHQAKKYGLELLGVNPAYTSQKDHENPLMWGHREYANILFLRNGKVVKLDVNADVAPINIFNVFYKHDLDLHSLECEPIKNCQSLGLPEGSFLAKGQPFKEDEENENKLKWKRPYTAHKLLRRYGLPCLVITPDGRPMPIDEKIFSKIICKHDTVRHYLHQADGKDVWYAWNDHKKEIENLANLFKQQNASGEKVSDRKQIRKKQVVARQRLTKNCKKLPARET